MYLSTCAGAYAQLQLRSEATECLRQAQALGLDLSILHFRWAEIHLAQGDLLAALACATRSIEGSDRHNFSEPHFAHGLALLCMGEDDQAEAAYARGIQIESDWIGLATAEEDLNRQVRRFGALPGAKAIHAQLQEAAERLKAAWPQAPVWRDTPYLQTSRDGSPSQKERCAISTSVARRSTRRR